MQCAGTGAQVGQQREGPGLNAVGGRGRDAAEISICSERGGSSERGRRGLIDAVGRGRSRWESGRRGLNEVGGGSSRGEGAGGSWIQWEGGEREKGGGQKGAECSGRGQQERGGGREGG